MLQQPLFGGLTPRSVMSTPTANLNAAECKLFGLSIQLFTAVCVSTDHAGNPPRRALEHLLDHLYTEACDFPALPPGDDAEHRGDAVAQGGGGR